MTRKLAPVLIAIGDESAAISHHLLSNLSDLNTTEMDEFRLAWETFSGQRRIELINALIELAEEHVEYDYRSIFRWALTDSDAAIRASAIEGLWEDTSPALVSIFARLLAHDAATEVRSAAAISLGRFVLLGEYDEVPQALADRSTQALWDSFHHLDEDTEVRRRALEAIAPSSRPGIDRLLEQAFYDANPLMQVSAVYGMGRTADRSWISTLAPVLRHDAPEMRLEAVRALGELEAREAVLLIVQMIAREQDSEVRMAALAALGQIGGDDARRALEAALEWEDDAVVVAAEAALEELMSSEGGTLDVIQQVIGSEWSEAIDEEWDGDWGSEDDYEEDPIEAEIRRLLDERDEP